MGKLSVFTSCHIPVFSVVALGRVHISPRHSQGRKNGNYKELPIRVAARRDLFYNKTERQIPPAKKSHIDKGTIVKQCSL